MIQYYTDGSCKNNGTANACGANGFVCYKDDELIRTYVDSCRDTTNQREEIKGVLAACRDAITYIEVMEPVEIITDSSYVFRCWHDGWYRKWARNGWINSQRQPVANRDLWEELIPFFDKPNFHFVKTKGHAADERNNHIDALVQSAAESVRQEVGN